MLLSSLSLGASLVSSSGGGVISAENSSLNLSSGRAYINLGFLTFGDIGRTGLLDAFDNPHSSFSGLSPRAIKPGSNKEGRDGFVLSFEDFSFIYSTDERALSGIFIDGGIIEAALLAASGNGEAKGFHEDPGMSTAYDTVYGGLDLSWGYLNVIGLISYADEIGFRGVLKGGFNKDDYSLYASYGSLIALSEDSEEGTFGLSGSFGQNGFHFEFSVLYGTPPVFSEDYLRKEVHVSSELNLGAVSLAAESESVFTKNGKRRHRECFTLSWSFLDIGYDTEEGIILSFDFGHFSFGYKDGLPYLAMLYEGEGDIFSFIAEYSTDDGLDLAIRVNF